MSNLTPNTQRSVKVAVLCQGGSGPVLHACEVDVTQAQVDNGEHYDLAKESAEAEGFEQPMIAFDAADPAARQLSSVAGWLVGTGA